MHSHVSFDKFIFHLDPNLAGCEMWHE